MTDRYEQAESNPPSRYGEARPTTLWLAVIPMVVVSLIALAGGHLAFSQAGAAQSPGTSGADDATPLDPTPAAQIAHQDALDRRSVEATTTTVAPSPAPSSTQKAHSPTVAAATAPSDSGCAAAEQYLAAHAAPGFTVYCPSAALGHEAMTCVDVAGLCPGQRIIRIADPCPAAYMNEAHNSWILTGLATGRMDPYGACI